MIEIIINMSIKELLIFIKNLYNQPQNNIMKILKKDVSYQYIIDIQK